MGLEAIEEEKEMYPCYICNEVEFDTRQKLGAHQGHCKLKHPDRLERSTRVPFGTPNQRFSISKEDQDKYHYHVFNDNWRKEPGRIQRALSAGYELVDHDRSGESSGTNDDGSEIKGVLMRQPIETYRKDQAAKARQMDKVDEQISRGEFKTGENTYLPSGGIKTEVKIG
jgi:hypothetical protein